MTDANMWQANLLRFTVFPEPDYNIDPEWWIKVVDEVPERENSQPRKGITQYEGQFGDGKLILGVQPARIDWIFTTIDDPEIESLGEFTGTSKLFTDLVQKWLSINTSPNILRIALGAILIQHVASRQAGYALLGEKYLKFNPQFEPDTSDFLFQINRPRPSDVANDVKINRLTKWSVASLQKVQLFPIQKSLPEKFTVRLEVDINSDQNKLLELKSDDANRLLSELTQFAFEIAEEGDIK